MTRHEAAVAIDRKYRAAIALMCDVCEVRDPAQLDADDEDAGNLSVDILDRHCRADDRALRNAAQDRFADREFAIAQRIFEILAVAEIQAFAASAACAQRNPFGIEQEHRGLPVRLDAYFRKQAVAVRGLILDR